MRNISMRVQLLAGKRTFAQLFVVVLVLPFSAQALTINLIYDSTVTSLTNAAQVEDAFAVAVQTFQSLYTNPITVNITVNWGNSDFGNSGSTLDGWPSYAQLTNALRDAATTAADRSALASLPATDPIASQHVYWIPRAEAKALTDFNSYFNINPNDTNIDGGVSFASNILRSHLDRLHGVSLVIFLRAEN